MIDDQISIHEDYRKVIGRPVVEMTELDDAAKNLFGDDEPAPHAAWVCFDLDSAYQGEQGFELVKKALEEGRPYALAFVDIRMPPGWDGIETIKRIWEVDPEILIVICSAYSDYSWEQMIEQLGQSDRFLILKKPFEQIEIRQFAVALTERWNLIRTDALTGLLNRRAFSEHLYREFSRSNRHGTPLSCAMLDLDLFKRINDEIGHAAGDSVLMAVTEILKTQIRVSDFLCRIGGEELCVLLPQTDGPGAVQWAEKARLAIAAMDVRHFSEHLHVTVSIGVSTLSSNVSSPDVFVEQADTALRLAKQMGRNQVVPYGTNDSPEENGPLTESLPTPFSGVRAVDVMGTPIPSVRIDAIAGEAADLFLRCNVTSVAVTDSGGYLRGVLTEKDIMPELLRPNGRTTSVGHLMRTDFVSYSADTPIVGIFDFLSRVTINHVFVVRDHLPIGDITRSGILRWLHDRLSVQSIDVTLPPLLAASIQTAHGRAKQAALDLARRANLLTAEMAGTDDGPVPPLLDVLFEMQELMNDLMFCARQPWPRATTDTPSS